MRQEQCRIIWGLDYAKQGCLRRLGVGLHETVLQGVSWGLGYVKWACWHRLGVRLCELRLLALAGGSICKSRLLALAGGSITHNKAFCIGWGLVCVKKGCRASVMDWVTPNEANSFVWGLGCAKWACSATHLYGSPYYRVSLRFLSLPISHLHRLYHCPHPLTRGGACDVAMFIRAILSLITYKIL